MLENKLLSLFRYLIVAAFILNSAALVIPPDIKIHETGKCLKLVPNSQAVNDAIANGLVEAVPDFVDTSSNKSWIPIIDCCDGLMKDNETLRCTCTDGWRQVNSECKPICRSGCGEHEYCFGPDVCECEFGYQKVNGVCRPVCLHECPNGECVAPRNCRCHRGYYLNETKMCEPLCEGGCPHGHCQTPGICACDDGYIHPPHTRETCVPRCPASCTNGICHSPGTCTCNTGYTRNSSDGSCVPQCENGCSNGECVAPEQCRCNSGYALHRQSKQCIKHNGSYEHVWYRPNASDFVPNPVIGLNDSATTAKPILYPTHTFNRTYESERQDYERQDPRILADPNSDRFNRLNNSRYEQYESQGIYNSPRYTPRPVKTPSHRIGDVLYYNSREHVTRENFNAESYGYRNGVILGSNRPQENIIIKDMSAVPETHIVITPHSVPRVNAESRKPYDFNVKGRETEWILVEEKRVPENYNVNCRTPCINGESVGVNQCRCTSGYRKDPRNPNGNVCVPICTGGCLNGVCTAPNLCLCNAGFVKENGYVDSQRCVAVD